MLSQWAEVAYFLKPANVQTAGGPQQLTANGTPLYTLYRRQRLLGRNRSAVIPATSWPYYYDVSFPQPPTRQAPVAVNTAQSVNVPENRLGMDPNTPGGILNNPPITAPPPPATRVMTVQDLLGGTGTAQAGDDLLLTNVLSFDIKVLEQGGSYGAGPPYDGNMVPVFVDLPPATSNRNPAFRNVGLSLFDTWSKQGNYGDPANGWNSTNANSPYCLPLKMRIVGLQVTIRVWDDRTGQARQMSIIQDM
jgi:hypothetical protein